MSDNVVRQIGELLNQPVPDHYLKALAEYPEWPGKTRRALDESAAEGLVCQVEYLNDLSDVLFLNLEARSDSVLDPAGFEILWPEQFLIIGESGGGDYYCIDAGNDVDGVMQFDHQAVQFEVIADSIDEYIEVLRETFCGSEDHELDGITEG